MIERAYFHTLKDQLLNSPKIIILFGPRQVGKTTLTQKILDEIGLKTLSINGDERRYRDIMSSQNLDIMKGLVSGYEIIFIDEAQRIPDIGLNLKILHDGLPDLKIIVTGSSSFELANRTREALTGRTWTFILYPIAVKELAKEQTPFELHQKLEEMLIFGMYPELFSISNHNLKIRYLQELISSYLYKDILELSNIKHSEKLQDLLRLIAFQLGSQVSLSELGRQLGMSKDTVAGYLDLLEKGFVLFKLRGYSRNLRKEVTRMNKYYFYDIGVRNAIIGNFNPMAHRNDAGQLWENFLMVEHRKKLAYEFTYINPYFWRTYNQVELDYLEEGMGRLDGFEFKYGRRKPKAPKSWLDTYPEATYSCISQENYLDFII